MRAILQAAILAMLLVCSVHAIDVTSLMVQGNRYYEQGEFSSAIESYEKILASDIVSTPVFYNLGCAYFSEKQYGRAILNFEKARQLSPRDPDVQHNLEYTKLFLKDRFELPEEMPLVTWFKGIRSSLALAELKFLEQLLFGLVILGLILYRVSSNHSLKRIVAPATIVSAILLLIVGGWLIDRAISLDAKHAILLVDEAEVTSAPIRGSSTLFVIHEGTSAKILDATEAWYELRLEDGKTGWISHEVVGLY